MGDRLSKQQSEGFLAIIPGSVVMDCCHFARKPCDVSTRVNYFTFIVTQILRAEKKESE
jgi:hypothetical protein